MKTATLAIARSCRNRLDIAGCMRFAGGALPAQGRRGVP